MRTQPIQKPWYKHPFVWMVIFIPSLAVIVSLSYVFIAYHGKDDLVRDDYYQDAKAVNEDLSRDTEASMGQYHAILEVLSSAINVTVTTTNQVQTPASIILNFYHFTKEAKDRAFILKQTTDGHYTANIKPNDLDDLNGKFTVELDGITWRLRSEVSMPQEHITLAANPLVSTKSSTNDKKHF